MTVFQLAFVGILIYFITPTPAQLRASDLDWDKAVKEIQRLSPRQYKELPANIVEELDRRRCTIPQVDGFPQPHNVVKGSFTGRGEIDWAVLCSRDEESSIYVFRDQSIEGVMELAGGPDKNSLQNLGGRIGYSRMISAVGGETIFLYHKEFGGPKPPSIDHQGIEDSFVGKASVIRYYYGGDWLRLTGAD